ncbi:MAG: wax ester/triacylglycerol synthase family O-acyltransferase [Pseudomonadales bacterium]
MRLTESDSSFLYGESAGGPLQTAGVAIIDGEVPFADMFKHIEERVHLVPRFRQRMVWVPMNFAHPKWVDDPDFDLTNHVVHHEMEPGSELIDAVDAAVKLNEGLMDRNIPLWKYTVITGVKDHTLLLQQIHHAMIDGASAVHLSTVMFDYQADAPPPPPPTEKWQPAPIPNPFELATEAFGETVRAYAEQNPLRMFSQSSDNQALLNRGMQAMARFAQPAVATPWNSGTLSPRRKMRYQTYPFSDYREIRKAFGGTVNDVVLTTVSEGAARYLAAHGETVDNQKIRIMCPVNVRTENESGALGNRVSAIFPMLPAWPMDLIERHLAVCAETSRIKEGGEAQAMTLMQESGMTTPPMLFAGLQLIGTPFDPTQFSAQNPPPVLPRMGPRPPFFGVNFVCTNVPGVQVAQYIAGHEILDTTAIMMMGGNMGYAICVGSYNQKMILNFTCEPRLLPDLEQMVEFTDAAFTELLDRAREALAQQTG